VDPALVLHYFGSKRGLFEAAMRLPFDPAEALPRILAGDPDTVGRRLAEFAVGIWEREETRRVLLGVVRAAASDPGAAAMLREVVGRELFSALATSLPGPDPQLRANLAASQIVGLGMARHVIQVQPLASADPAALVEWLAPTLQRYLTGAAPGGGEGGGG
jgi:AcrR family transcriptional regulator